MGGDGVSEVGAGAGVRVGGMVNGTSLASGSIAGPEACGDGRSVGAETCVHNELVKVGGFFESDRGGLARRFWVEGSEKRMWKSSLRIHLRW